MGVGDLPLTPIMNFEGERPWLEPVPHYSYYETNPQILEVITNLRFALFIFKYCVYAQKNRGLFVNKPLFLVKFYYRFIDFEYGRL